MAYQYNDLYKVFNDVLMSRYGIDWFEVYDKYRELGNFAGIYPDTALLLMTLVDKTPIQSVGEIGSGASTLFLRKACLKKGINITSYEEQDKYATINEKLLNVYGVGEDPIIRYTGRAFDFSDVGMVFIDSSEAQRIDILRESKTILDVPLVVMDDFGSPDLTLAFTCFLRRCSSERPFYVFNGVGREDRHQIISWRPDVIPPVRDIINSSIPRIGVS